MTASDIYHRALKSKENDPNFSKFLLESNDSVFCAYYASNVIRGPWEEANDIIKDHPYATLIYARDAIKGRWEEGEKTILDKPLRMRRQKLLDPKPHPLQDLLSRNACLSRQLRRSAIRVLIIVPVLPHGFAINLVDSRVVHNDVLGTNR